MKKTRTIARGDYFKYGEDFEETASPVAAAPVAEASDEPQQVIVPGANEWDAPRIYIKPKEQVSPPPLSPPLLTAAHRRAVSCARPPPC